MDPSDQITIPFDEINKDILHNIGHFIHSQPDCVSELYSTNLRFLSRINANRKTDKAVCVTLLINAYRAFVASGTLLESLQLPSCYPLIRTILESSLYAFAVGRSSEYTSIWVNRNKSGKARTEMRNAFSTSKLLKLLADIRPERRSEFEKVYEFTIEYGAHPNPKGVLPYFKMTEKSYEYRFSLFQTEAVHINGTKDILMKACQIALDLFDIALPTEGSIDNSR